MSETQGTQAIEGAPVKALERREKLLEQIAALKDELEAVESEIKAFVNKEYSAGKRHNEIKAALGEHGWQLAYISESRPVIVAPDKVGQVQAYAMLYGFTSLKIDLKGLQKAHPDIEGLTLGDAKVIVALKSSK